jgi:hypothetical protein
MHVGKYIEELQKGKQENIIYFTLANAGQPFKEISGKPCPLQALACFDVPAFMHFLYTYMYSPSVGQSGRLHLF